MESADLQRLEELLARARHVVSLRKLRNYKGYSFEGIVGMRHDVDDRGWDSVLDMARWEHDRGYTSTYYFLHTAPYWGCDTMSYTLRQIADMGHEIGLHNNALVEGIKTNKNPWSIFDLALDQLRWWSCSEVTSTAAHGDSRCYDLGVVNYAMFEEAPVKPPWKSPEEIGVKQRALPYNGIEFCGDWLPRQAYLSDSGGTFNDKDFTLEDAHTLWPFDVGPLIILQHPDWWDASLFRT